jgi:hypothetical protein
VALAGPGTPSLDSALGLQFDPTVRSALVALGAIGGLIALSVPRVTTRHDTANAGSS